MALTQRPNFDAVAHPYRWMEYLTFGPLLERCRFAQLDKLGDPKRALVLGDGDGRFLARLLTRYPSLRADVVELSPAMAALARRRVAAIGASARAVFHVADARALLPTPDTPYDLVAAHFFLDCLSDGEVNALLDRLAPLLAPQTTLLVSEFAVPARGPLRPIARLLIRSLYLAFLWLTGLAVQRLPDYPAALRRSGFALEEVSLLLGGILRGERWLRATEPRPADSQPV